jgi:hypothetical protein
VTGRRGKRRKQILDDIKETKGSLKLKEGNTVALLVEALSYNLGSRGFDSRWGHWEFSLTSSSGRNMALGLTQPLTEMNTRDISWG